VQTLSYEHDRRTVQRHLGSKLGWAITLALAALGAYLLWTHTGHVVYALPYLFLLACPLMHVFGHHHGHHIKPEDPK
jgi:hypothetical protein